MTRFLLLVQSTSSPSTEDPNATPEQDRPEHNEGPDHGRTPSPEHGGKGNPESLGESELPREPEGQGGTGVPYDATFPSPPTRLYVPADLDKALSKILPKRRLRFIDHYRWIIHSIVTRRLTDRRFEEDSFIPLHHEIIRAHISVRLSKEFLLELEQWEFIQCKKRYWPSHESKGYRLSPVYRHSRLASIKITDRLLKEKISARQVALFKEINDRNDGYSYTARGLVALAIDEVSAHEHTGKHFIPDSDSFNTRFLAIDSIATKQFRFVIDKSGRAHQNISNLASDLRPFVSIDGRPLYQVDVACSQPWLMHWTLRHLIHDAEEVKRMEDLLTSGRFYTELNVRNIDLDDFKEAFFKHVLFGRGDYSNWITRAFESQFPSYAKAIAQAKENGYKLFAIILQQAEARVIFDAVQRFVRATGGQVPVLTIHDSLVTWPEWTHTARDALEAAFHDQYGAKPLLRVKAPTTEIKSNKNSERINKRKMIKKQKLTCVEVKVIDTMKTAHGTLIRFYVRFSNGESGEYWGKTEASAKNFPLNIPHWYKSEVLTKRDGNHTRKYQPCKKDEIPLTEHGDEALGDVPVQQALDLHEPAAAVSRPFSKGEPNFRSGGATAEDIAALKGTLHLVSHGKIGMDEIEPTALKLKEIIIKISKR